MAEKAAQEEVVEEVVVEEKVEEKVEEVEEVKDDEPAKPKKLTKFQMQMQRAFY
jgi:hypothetical protein